MNNIIINNFSFYNLELLFENFDLTLYKHYKNLTYIKISLFLLNSLLLIYLYFLDSLVFQVSYVKPDKFIIL